MALATKIYGGYIVLAGLGAFWFSSETRWRQSPWLLIGFLAGIFAASPFLWIAPADWWNDLLAESFFQYRIGTPALTATKFTTITTGLNYLPRVLIYRFEWPWFVLALGGLFFLFFFRPRKNLFFIIPYSASLAIIALRLSYLREWDLVNLTPFLSLSIAFLITGLLETIKNKVLRGSAVCLFVLFLIFQGAVTWGEAWVARFPDTREFARRWVLQQVDRGSTLNYDLNLSSTYSVWVPENAGIKLSGARINRFLSEKDKTSPPPGQAWVLERTWWEPTLPETRYRPIQIFKLHNTYWENPDILIFRPPFPPRPSELILPHLRVRSSEPAFPNTPWSQKQPLDLLSEPGTSSRQIFFASRDMEAMGFALLGQGKAKVYFGPALGFPVKVQQGGLTTGVLKRLRRWPPLSPRVYALHLKNPEKDQTLWLGLFPSPEEMAPLLCRFEAWKDLEQAAYMGLKRQDAPGELSLFYALALAAQKREPEARAHLENLSREKSEFLNSYRSLVSSQGQDLEEALRRMTGASRKELLREEVVWPYSNQGDDKEMAGNWPAPQVVAKSHEFHLWLPHYFLPGFFKASLNIGFQKGPASRGVHLKIIALWSGRYFKELSRIPLQPGQTEITIPIPFSIGPVRFEFQIDSQEAAWPVIQSLVLTPDHEAEWKWRWSLFNRYLDLNPFLSSTAPHPRDLDHHRDSEMIRR